MNNIEKAASNLEILKFFVEKKTSLNESGYGKCPFHDEDTASFHIYLEKKQKPKKVNGTIEYADIERAQYHCFGCGAHGDVLNFLRETESISTGAAIAKALRASKQNHAPFSPFKGPEDNTATTEFVPGPLPGYNYFCELKCEKFARLREDYEALTAENYRLRDILDMGPFRPTGKDAVKREAVLTERRRICAKLLDPPEEVAGLLSDIPQTTLLTIAAMIDSDFKSPFTTTNGDRT